MKQSEEAEQKDDLKHCKYHRLVGYVIQDFFVFKDKVMQLAHQSKISLEEDSAETNVVTIKNGYFDGNKDACNTKHGDNTEDTLLEKEDSSDADDCMSTITFTDEDLLLGSMLHHRPLFIAGYVFSDSKSFTKAESHFIDAKYYIEGDKKVNEILPFEEPKSCGNQSTRKNDSSTMKIELSKDLTLSLTQINLKQPSKQPLKGFVPSTQEEEGEHEVLVIDEKGFDPKVFILYIKAGFNPKEKLSLGKLPPETTGKKLHELNAT
ncbi:UNVERIFIED_CONTAM: hypothetical protein Sradi_3195800 [Sesamum radiatum]|uniref:Uncharacterized protein n=1 Tax=Sesamum radiatum TaxID=300843 RepID=A0AAW2RHH6_SESRA